MTLAEGRPRQVSKRSEQRPRTASRGSCCCGRRWPGSIFGLIGSARLPKTIFASPATASTDTRPAATSSSSRSTTGRFAEVGNWPWPRRYDAQTGRPADRGRSEAHLLRHQFHLPDQPADDGAFAEAIERSGKCRYSCARERGRYGSSEPVLDRRPARSSPGMQARARSASATITRMRSGSCPMPR